MRSGSLFGSANSRTSHTPLQGILTSPLGNRQEGKADTGEVAGDE